MRKFLRFALVVGPLEHGEVILSGHSGGFDRTRSAVRDGRGVLGEGGRDVRSSLPEKVRPDGVEFD